MAGNITGIIIMTDLALVRVLSWLSPVFPTGSFAYSSGLETTVTQGWVRDENSLQDWLRGQMKQGRWRNDLIFLGAAWAADNAEMSRIDELALASCSSQEQLLEATAQGAAFNEGLAAWNLPLMQPVTDRTLAVTVGEACRLGKVPLPTAQMGYLHATITNQAQIAIRLSVLGQQGAARVLYELEPAMTETVTALEDATLDDLATFAPLADIAAMRHETQTARMFRT